MPEPSNDRVLAKLMAIGQVGFEMVAPIGIGWAVDYFIGTMPIFMIVGAMVGLVGGVFHLIVLNRPGAR